MKRYYIWILIFIISFSLSSFSNQNPLKLRIPGSDKLKSVDSLTYKSYTLRIETIYLKDSVSYEERHLFRPIVVDQYLIFLKNGKTLAKKSNLSEKIYQKASNGHKILMLSNVYYSAYIVFGKYKTVFAIAGFGGCNSCSETLKFYTLSGDLAYGGDSTFGWNRFLKEYGIVNYSKSDNEVTIYPPNPEKD